MEVLVLNSGSSSMKHQLFDMRTGVVRAGGVVERIGEAGSSVRFGVADATGELASRTEAQAIADHGEALAHVFAALADAGLARDLIGIGHRVVHGGERFLSPTVISAEVIDGIRAQIPLAPLHNPANLAGIEVALAQRPDVPQVAVFDTAFHRTLPPHAYRYAIPARFYREHGVRRYGFHGTSHAFVARRAAAHLGRAAEDVNLITAHLGNGASITAIAGGRSIDTSMGLSPLEGLVMGTRSGDLDPAIIFHLQRVAGLDATEVDRVLNKESGLKGLCGDNDLRTVEERAEVGDTDALLALEVYAYRIRKYIGAYTAALGHVDALVFTAGVGENSPTVRARVLEGLSGLGYALDTAANDRRADGALLDVTGPGARTRVLVVPTDEEFEIAAQTLASVQDAASGS